MRNLQRKEKKIIKNNRTKPSVWLSYLAFKLSSTSTMIEDQQEHDLWSRKFVAFIYKHKVVTSRRRCVHSVTATVLPENICRRSK